MTSGPTRGNPDGSDRIVRKDSPSLELLSSLYALLRTAIIHEADNEAMEQHAKWLARALEANTKDGRCAATVVVAEDQYFVNDVRVNVPPNQFHLVRGLEEIYHAHNVGGVEFLELPPLEHIKEFALLFRTSIGPDGRPKDVSVALAKAGIGTIQVVPPMRLRLEGERTLRGKAVPPEVNIALAYTKSISVLEQLVADERSADIGGNHGRGIVREIVEALTTDADLLIGMTQWGKDGTDIPRAAVDLCVVSLAMGLGLGLKRSYLADLGIASLMLAKISPDGGSWLESHPLHVLKELESDSHWNAPDLRRVLTMAESGHAFMGPTRSQFKLARIYRIARQFIVLTHGLSSGLIARPPMSPYHALLRILSLPSGSYDPFVVETIIRTIGPFPVGTSLMLTDGRWAISVGRDTDGETLIRPRLKKGRYGAPMKLARFQSEIDAIHAIVDPLEQASAVFDSELRQLIGQIGENVAFRPKMAGLALRRMMGQVVFGQSTQ